jgi:SAM-dependent methyltransferase
VGNEAEIAAIEYASLDPLRTRIEVHRRYSEYADDVESNVDEAVGPDLAGSVLDIGCGTGTFLRRLAAAPQRNAGAVLVGLDYSAAAVAALAGSGSVGVRADAQLLPFGAASFDAVTARHMLYHVPRPDRAIREARRVLRPGGVFAAVVNLERATPALLGLVAESVAAHGFAPIDVFHSVHAGNIGGLVGDVFAEVRVRRYDNALVFDSPEPVVAYAVSCLNGFGVPPDDPRRPAVVATVAERARALFAGGGPLRDPKGYVVVTAT